jgi:hypothetical protein
MRMAELPIPSTPAARLAEEVVAQFAPIALVNHCVRAYLFAAALAATDGIAIDHELLYVSSMLHDLGLEPAFDNHELPFEHAGGNVAWVFAAGAGWSATRRTRAAEIIVAHMTAVDAATDPEGHVLARATSLDISGYDPQHWPAELLSEVIDAHPRLDLGVRFTACFQDQAARKPDSTAGVSFRGGITERIANNPLERL